jgi:hypothetical protein
VALGGTAVAPTNTAHAVALSGNRAYVAGDAGLRIFDVSSPSSASLEAELASVGAVRDLAVDASAGRAYLADDFATVGVVDLFGP